jgi:hypothetical protein
MASLLALLLELLAVDEGEAEAELEALPPLCG